MRPRATTRHFTDRRGLYQYSSVQVNVPDILADQIIDWGDEKIAEKDVYAPPNDYIHGREDEPHITLLYGIHAHTPIESRLLLSERPPFEVKLGQVSIFTTNVEFDVVKIEVTGPELFKLNNLLTSNIKNTTHYVNYKPHITISYVNKNACKDLIGNKHFEGWKWTVNSLVFSSTNGQKSPIRLNTSRPVICF